jgi:hypothetical protein
MGRPNFEKLEVYQLSEKLADEIWNIVKGWDSFTQDQLVSKLFDRLIVSVLILRKERVDITFKIIDVLLK